MKFWMTAVALVCMVMPMQAKKVKTPRSRNASAYATHKAPKVKARKLSKTRRTQKNKFKNRVN